MCSWGRVYKLTGLRSGRNALEGDKYLIRRGGMHELKWLNGWLNWDSVQRLFGQLRIPKQILCAEEIRIFLATKPPDSSPDACENTAPL